MTHSRVIIIEDDVALRKSLNDWLSKEYLVRVYESAEVFLDAIDDFEFEDGIPTCILLDFQMPGMTGVQLQSQLQQMNMDYPVIFMSGNAQQADIIDAWHGGAVDFILKPFTGNKLNKILVTVFQKSENIKKFLPRAIHKKELIALPISQREAEVLLLLGEGHRQHEIANMLNVTLRTIKWHRSNIKNKLNLNTLVELARYCDEYRSSIENIALGH